jgi:hypothetical protein
MDGLPFVTGFEALPVASIAEYTMTTFSPEYSSVPR